MYDITINIVEQINNTGSSLIALNLFWNKEGSAQLSQLNSGLSPQ